MGASLAGGECAPLYHVRQRNTAERLLASLPSFSNILRNNTNLNAENNVMYLKSTI